MAFWNEDVDEVHGFTFSGGYQLQVANSAATDLHFMIPAGTSRIAFHVIKPKHGTPYEAIRAFTSGPYLTLANQVDKLFASAGNELTYTLTYNNTGDSDATDAVIEDVLPSGLELIEGSISDGGIYNSTTRQITWNIGPLIAGAEADTVTFKARVVQGTVDGTQIVNTARIWAIEQLVATTASVVTTVGGPSIASISPNKGGNTGIVTVTINGSRLDPNAEVKLTKEGEESITAYLLTGSADGTRLMARFDLIGNKSGSWDLVISNPGNGSDTEPFDVIEGGEAKLAMSFAGPSTIREGRGAMFTVILKNEGLVDLGPVIVNMTPESVEKTRAGSYAHSGNPPYSCSKCSSQSSEQTTPPLFFSPIMIGSVPAGEETLIPISVIAIPSPSEDCWLVTAEVRYSLSEEMIRQEECEKLQKYWVELGKLIEKYQSMYTQVQTVWITTADTSAIFAGQDGHTYRFYSIARDNVGNIESAPETPDAETTVTVTAIQEGIAVSPNPFVPTRGHTQISFFGAGLPYSKIKIYNKAAELVRTLEETEGKTRLDWDATSDDGKKLASGVYIWVSTDQAGKHQKGKFAIIR